MRRISTFILAIGLPISMSCAMAEELLPDMPMQLELSSPDGRINDKGSGDHGYMLSGTMQTTEYASKRKVKPVAERIPVIYASIINDTWPDYSRPRYNFGLFRLPVEVGGEMEMVKKDFISRYGGVKIGDSYYQTVMTGPVHSPVWKMRVFDTKTWNMKEEHVLADQSLVSLCAAADPVSGNVYGCFSTADGSGYEIGIADFTNRFRAKLRSVTNDADKWNACAFAPDGKLYAINMEGYLMRINLTTGKGTVIGFTGLVPSSESGGVVDPDSGRFFYVPSTKDAKARLYEIDLQTGRATLITRLPDGVEVAGLCTEAAFPVPTAPGLPQDITSDFPNGSLSGKIRFKAPTTTYNGKAASGPISYEVSEGERKLAEGSSSYGAAIEVDVTLTKDTIHDIHIIFSNSAGKGPRGFLRGFFGFDTPDRPENVTGVWNDSDKTFTLSWPRVAVGANNGYINPDEITYELTLYPDSTQVKTGIKENKAVISLPSLGTLQGKQIGVKAVYKDRKSEEELSNKAVGGAVTLPYLEQFTAETIPDGYYVLNVDKDLNTWRRYSDEEWIRVHKNPDKEKALDDWVFTPPLLLEGGKSYQVSGDLSSFFAGCTEKVVVKWGRNNTPDAMTNTGIDTLEIVPSPIATRYFLLTAPETGIYYVGYHAVSDPNQGSLVLDNVFVSEPVEEGAPAQVRNLKVAAGENCQHYSMLNFIAPSADVSGKALDAIDRIVIVRNGENAGKIDNPQPGAALSYRDNYLPGGEVEYEVYAIAGGVKGVVNRTRTFIGAYIPEPVRNATIKETDNPGEIMLSWEAPLKDLRGNVITPEYLTYNIYKVTDNGNGWVNTLVRDSVKGETVILQSCDKDKQEFAYYGIRAKSVSGLGGISYTEMIPVGKGYGLPFNFSFTREDFNKYIFGLESLSGVWSVVGDSDVNGVKSYDGDDAFAIFKADSPGCKAAFFTGKVELPANTEPLMTFRVFKNESVEYGANKNTIELQVNIGNGWVSEKKVVINDLKNDGWNLVSIPVGKYSGKSPRFRFEAVCVNYSYLVLDDIRTVEAADCDLAVTALRVPSDARINKPFTAVATVQNNSAVSAKDFSVDILVNSVKRASVNVADVLAGGSEMTVDIPVSMMAIDKEKNIIQAKVNWSKDSKPENDISASMTLTLGFPRMNAPSGLSGKRNEDGVVELSWIAPAEEGNVVEPVMEDFESYESWQSTKVGEWQFVDRDGGGIGGVNGLVFPKGIKKGTIQSWWILNDDYSDLNASFQAYSGNQYISQMYSADLSSAQFKPVKCDDWAISPRLFGCDQTISLFARSYSPQNLETMEVLVSLTDDKPESFVRVKEFVNIPYLWKKFEVNLPEGARYFAIRCTSLNEFMLHVDDVGFIPVSDTPFVLEGYKIYRNGEPVGTTKADECHFVETPGQIDCEYRVTALYNHGESVPSESITVGTTGIASSESSMIDIYVSGSDIIVEGAEGKDIAVICPDGKIVTRLSGSNKNVIKVAAGIYIVKAGNASRKVIVR